MDLGISTSASNPNKLILLASLTFSTVFWIGLGQSGFLFLHLHLLYGFDTGVVYADILHIFIRCPILEDLLEEMPASDHLANRLKRSARFHTFQEDPAK